MRDFLFESLSHETQKLHWWRMLPKTHIRFRKMYLMMMICCAKLIFIFQNYAGQALQERLCLVNKLSHLALAKMMKNRDSKEIQLCLSPSQKAEARLCFLMTMIYFTIFFSFLIFTFCQSMPGRHYKTFISYSCGNDEKLGNPLWGFCDEVPQKN